MRVAMGGISHETSTFTLVPTTLQSFKDRHYHHGSEIVDIFRGTNTPIGGFIAGAEAHGFELIPTMLAEAHPSGPPPRRLFDDLLSEIVQGIRDAGQVDGVLLELHGSMVVGKPGSLDGLDDPEGHILKTIRDVVGPDVPILAQLDIHSNVSQQMVDQATVLNGRETYPEVDMAARGRECADVLHRILTDGLRPTMALHQIPMMWGMNQVTAHSPMKEAIAELHRIEAQPGVICGSIATCFPLSDVPDMGASVYIATDNDPALAQSYADELGEWLYERRADWHFRMPPTKEALAEAEAAGKFPVIFADRNDNTGGGSPGDSTGLLKTFIEAGLKDACVLYMVDPEAITQCHRAGVGATLTLDVGGKASPMQGKPVSMTVEVMGLSEGGFQYDGPMYAGLTGNMGPSAYIRQAGIHVILVTQREQPFCTAFSRTLGLDPRQMRYLGIKSAAHFRAGFEAWAGAVYVVSEPSLHDATFVEFHRLGRKVYPLDES
ncbi:MAG: M81 family metallopeptidase [Chloroflexota bacterium]